MKPKNRWMGLLFAGLAIAAIMQELRKPAGRRDWHGKVAGFVPYDFRLPSPARYRAAWWNPGDQRLFASTAFGIGWSVNWARVLGR
jgi:hypothetical protein